MHFEEHSWYEPDLFLFADEDLVEEAENTQRHLCPVEKSECSILVPDKPWEGAESNAAAPPVTWMDAFVGSIVYEREAGLYHFWYANSNQITLPCVDPALGFGKERKAKISRNVLHAVSRDGLAWEKPNLNLVVYNGSRENNIVRSSAELVVPNYLPGAEGGLVGVYYDNFPDPIYPCGLNTTFSEDGLHWKYENIPVLPYDGDAASLVWDPARECYLLTTRSYQHKVICMRDKKKYKRHIAVSESQNLTRWTPLITVLEADGDDPDEAELYNMTIIPYGHGYLGLLWLFYRHPDSTRGYQEVQLAFSRDRLKWQRVGRRKPFLPLGLQGQWDSSQIWFTYNPPRPEGEGRMRFWYGGSNAEHWQAGASGLGTATLRRDGFVCWEAADTPGIVTTKAMQMNWASWPYLNVEATNGRVQVEILDAQTGAPLPGASREDCLDVTGDHVRAQIKFKNGNFLRHTGNIRFRFHLTNARIYAFKAPNVSFTE